MINRISNSISSLNNANSRKKLILSLPFTKKIVSLLKALKNEGYINHFFLKNAQLNVILKQNQKGNYVIRLKILTKSGLVNNISFYEIWKQKNQPETLFLNSSVGLVSNKKARLLNFGGTLLFCVK